MNINGSIKTKTAISNLTSTYCTISPVAFACGPLNGIFTGMVGDLVIRQHRAIQPDA